MLNKKITRSVFKATWVNIVYQMMPALFVLMFLKEYRSDDQWLLLFILSVVGVAYLYANKTRIRDYMRIHSVEPGGILLFFILSCFGRMSFLF